MYSIVHMKKQEIYETIILPSVKEDDQLVGYFQAMYRPPFWKMMLFGVFAGLSQRSYYVAVTSSGIFFHKLTLFGKPDSTTYYQWEEVVKMKIKKGVLQKPYMFLFSNGNKLTVRALVKGVSSKVALLNEETKAFLDSKLKEGRQG